MTTAWVPTGSLPDQLKVTPVPQSPPGTRVMACSTVADRGGHRSAARSVRVPVDDRDDDRGRRRPGSWRDDGVGQRGLARGGRRHGRREGGQPERGRGGSPDPRPRLVRPLSVGPRRASSASRARAVARRRGRGCPGAGQRAMVRGSGSGQPSGRSRRCSGASCHRGWAGPVRSGPADWADRRGSMARNGHWPRAPPDPQRGGHADDLRRPGRPAGWAPSSAGPCSAPRSSRPASGFAFLAIETPLVSRLIPAAGARRLDASSPARCSSGSWRSSPARPCSIAGTNRLAATVAAVRIRAAAAHAGRPDAVGPARRGRRRHRASLPDDGRPIPELVVGPFGVAVVHELGLARRSIRPSRQRLGATHREGLGAGRIPARSGQPRRGAGPPLADDR